jgi:hypothetical protein
MRLTLFSTWRIHVLRRNPNGELEEVPWESKCGGFLPRRFITLTRRIAERRKLGPDICEPWNDERKGDLRKGKVQRRTPFPFSCSSCRNSFPNENAFLQHHLSPLKSKTAKEGFSDKIERCLRLGIFSADLRAFIEIIDVSTSEDAFVRACKQFDFDERRGLVGYRADWFLSFFFYVRRDEISLDKPDRQDRNEALRIQKEYFRSHVEEQEAKRQEKIIRQVFDPNTDLKEIGKPGVGQPAIFLPPVELKAFQETLPLRGRKLAVALSKRGVPEAMKRYDDNPHNFPDWTGPRKEIARRKLPAK